MFLAGRSSLPFDLLSGPPDARWFEMAAGVQPKLLDLFFFCERAVMLMSCRPRFAGSGV